MADIVRTTTVAAEVISATPIPFVFATHFAVEVIASRAITADTIAITAGSTANVSGVVVHSGSFTAAASAIASASGAANSPFVGWGIPISL